MSTLKEGLMITLYRGSSQRVKNREPNGAKFKPLIEEYTFNIVQTDDGWMILSVSPYIPNCTFLYDSEKDAKDDGINTAIRNGFSLDLNKEKKYAQKESKARELGMFVYAGPNKTKIPRKTSVRDYIESLNI